MPQDLTDVFKRGCLINLQTSIWGGRVKMPKNAVEIDADDEFWSAVKFLVERDALKPIEKIRGEARAYLYNKSLPFPLSNVVFTPRDMISEIDTKMQDFMARFYEGVKQFKANYLIFIANAAPKLGRHFNPADYPQDIERKFSFRWQFYTVGIEGQSGILSPEIYEREKTKFKETMTDFAKDAVLALRFRFKEMLEHLVDRLCGYEKKVFRDSLIEAPKKFMDDFAKLNICDDKELSKVIEDTKNILHNIEPDSLRSDVIFRDSIGQQIKKVEQNLVSLMGDEEARDLTINFDE